MDLLLAPRKLVKKRKLDHQQTTQTPSETADAIELNLHSIESHVVVPAEPTDSTALTLTPTPTPSASASATAMIDDVLSSEEARDLLFEIEALTSDWSLSSNLDLLDRFTPSEPDSGNGNGNNFIGLLHLSNLLQLPSIANLLRRRESDSAITMNHLARVIRESDSDLVKLDDSGFKLCRLKPIDKSSITNTDWSQRSFYFENLPIGSYTPAQCRTYLSSLFSTSVQTVRFPHSYHDQSSRDQSRSSTNASRQQPNTNALMKPKDKATREKEKLNRLPAGGGTYKRFCFAVLGDDEAVEKTSTLWRWENQVPLPEDDVSDQEESTSSSEGDPDSEESDTESRKKKKNQSSTLTIQQKAKRFGFRSLPIAEWNRLRTSYLGYQRALQAIQEPASHTSASYSRSDRYSSSSHYAENSSDRFSRTHHDASRISSDHWSNHHKVNQRQQDESVVVLDWKSARDETYAKESAEIAKAESSFPEGTVCFIKNLHVATNRTTLKSLFNSAIETLGGIPKKDQVSYVDYENGLDSAHVRFSTPGAAVAVKMYFQSRAAIMSSNDMDVVSKLAKSTTTTKEDGSKEDDDGKPINVEILEGEKEAIYWQKVPLSARPQRTNTATMTTMTTGQRRDDRERKSKRRNL